MWDSMSHTQGEDNQVLVLVVDNGIWSKRQMQEIMRHVLCSQALSVAVARTSHLHIMVEMAQSKRCILALKYPIEHCIVTSLYELRPIAHSTEDPSVLLTEREVSPIKSGFVWCQYIPPLLVFY
eukprot:68795_1